MINQQTFDIVIQPQEVVNDQGVVQRNTLQNYSFALPNSFHSQHYSHCSVIETLIPCSIYTIQQDLQLVLQLQNVATQEFSGPSQERFTIHRGDISFDQLLQILQNLDVNNTYYSVVEDHFPQSTKRFRIRSMQAGYAPTLQIYQNPNDPINIYNFERLFGSMVRKFEDPVYYLISQYGFSLPSISKNMQIHCNAIHSSIDKNGSNDVLFQCNLNGFNFGDFFSYQNNQIQQTGLKYNGAKQLVFYCTDLNGDITNFQNKQEIYLKLSFYRFDEKIPHLTLQKLEDIHQSQKTKVI